MKTLFFIFALITFAFSQNLGNRPGCTVSFNGTIYSLSSIWYKYQQTNGIEVGEWAFNPCDSPNTANDEELEGMPTQAGAYFYTDENVFPRGYADNAIWNMETGYDVPTAIKVTMVTEMVSQANSACTKDAYYTNLYFYCGESDEPEVSMIDSTECEAWISVTTPDACATDVPQFKHARRVYIMTAPLFATIACASLLCCCICARRRRQAKILNSNFSNVAFQPIPIAHENRVQSVKAPVQPVHIPQFVRPNHIQVPRTYFFSEQPQPVFQNNSYVIPLEDFQKQDQMASDEKLARELQNQLNQ